MAQTNTTTVAIQRTITRREWTVAFEESCIVEAMRFEMRTVTCKWCSPLMRDKFEEM